ncbi:MAG: YifB family Mg chelatase-like AAA ATPase [Myxococcota bacterium]|jgi:magnesium chelatase family protein|nr:YifB family Mg chelatase-like AAA ATPase [Myxococcota bacterium]
MNVSLKSAALAGVSADLVTVEVDVSLGLPAFAIVGLPEGAVRESKVRVAAALSNCGYALPPRKVTVNLAPADLRKTGAAFDLAMALGLLSGIGLLDPKSLEGLMVVGELGLDGACRPVPGALPYSLLSNKLECKALLVPRDNAAEAAVVRDCAVIAVDDLPSALLHLTGETVLPRERPTEVVSTSSKTEMDLAEVRGQDTAKRALEVAAAGGHNLIMIGPPGSGKTMLARRLATILPPLVFEEMLEVSAAHSVLGLTSAQAPLVTSRPFRAPHHTVSDAGLVGGSNPPRPGEVSLAHNGVLFLDELLEFKRHVLEVLREPLEEGSITISRAAGQCTFPAAFTLVASMNPCPCGYLGAEDRACTCATAAVERYRAKLSGPLLDRIDLHVNVPAVKVRELTEISPTESSQAVRERVIAARSLQAKRFAGTPTRTNGQMTLPQIRAFCALDAPGKSLLERAIERLQLSARAYARILKVARTVADLADAPSIEMPHLAEAIGYRTLDRRGA